MAIFSKYLLGACTLAFVAQAAPLVLTVTDVVTVTTWATVSVNGTATVWASTDSTAATTTISSTSQTAPALPSTSASIVQVQQAVAPVTPTVPTTTAAITTTTTTAVVVAVNIQPTTFQTTTTTATPSPRSVDTATQAATASAASSGSTSSAGGTCVGSGSGCTGDITHYDGGLGACGWTVNTASDMEVALPVGLMGSQSNGNPYCGKSLTIKNPSTGATFQATVGDKCMGCSGYSIDLTDALFNAVTDGTGDGRVSGIDWWFN